MSRWTRSASRGQYRSRTRLHADVGGLTRINQGRVVKVNQRRVHDENASSDRLSAAPGCAAVCLVSAGNASAAGFALLEQNTSGLGNAYAGQAASAQDASTIFFNPAGMTLLPDRQIVLSANGVKPTANFSNTASTPPAGRAGLTGNGGDAGDWAVVPSLYAAFAITPDLRLGIGINSPFGLKTEYDAPWFGQYQALTSKLETINVNPALAYRVNNWVIPRCGSQLAEAKAELSNMVYLGAAGDGQAQVEGDSDAWAATSRVPDQPGHAAEGIAYRSNIKQDLEGDVTFTLPAGFPALPAVANGPVTASIDSPETASLSVFQRFNDKWDIMADITWTHWSRFQDLTVLRSNGTVLTTQPENWSDTWRFSIGLNYRATEKLMWRFGTSYDQTPVSDAYSYAPHTGSGPRMGRNRGAVRLHARTVARRGVRTLVREGRERQPAERYSRPCRQPHEAS